MEVVKNKIQFKKCHSQWKCFMYAVCIFIVCAYESGFAQVSLSHAGSFGAKTFLLNPVSVYVSGNFAYVASSNGNSLEIIDISNPTSPVQVGHLASGNGGALLDLPTSVFVSGNYAYVTAGINGLVSNLEIVDVTNPANPVHKGSLVNGYGGSKLDGASSVFVLGNYAYVVGSGALEIIDVTNPASPVHKGSITDGGGNLSLASLYNSTSVYVSGTYAYVTTAFGSSSYFEVVDISIPTAPVHAGKMSAGGMALLDSPESVFISGNYAYIASLGSNALEIVDITTPSAPVHFSSVGDGENGAMLNRPTSVYVSGNYAYVTSYQSHSLEIIDVSSPSVPNHQASIENGTGGALLTYPKSVFVSGTNAYVASAGNNALEVVDVTFASEPTHKGSLIDGFGNGALLGHPNSVFVSGTNAYMASFGSNALEILDVSNPAAVTHKGSLLDGTGGALLYGPQSVYVSGNYAYLTNFSSVVPALEMGELEIVDVTNPNVPVHKGSLKNGTGGALLSYPSSVFVSGNYAYLVNAINGSGGGAALEIVDVSNPATPIHAGSLTDGTGGALLSYAYSVYVSGKYAYVASGGSNALEIVDVSTPGAPAHAASLTNGTGGAVLGFPYSVYISGNYAYVTSFLSNALEIIDITNPLAPVHKGSLVDGTGGAMLKLPTSVYVSGKYALVIAAGSNALEIVDVSNPAAPVHAASLINGAGGAILDSPVSFSVSGNYVYAIDYASNTLEIISFSSPSSITVTSQPMAANLVCAGTSTTISTAATGTPTILYQWQFSHDGVAPFADLTNSGGYTNVSTSSFTINTSGNFGAGVYRCKISDGASNIVFTNNANVVINAIPGPPATTNSTACGVSRVSLTANGGTNGNYRWYTSATGGTAITNEVNSIYITPTLSATTTYYVSIVNSTCEGSRAPVAATIDIISKPSITTTNCTATSATIGGPAGFTGYGWSTGQNSQQIIVSSAGSFTLIVTDANGCNSPISDVVSFTSFFCNRPPVITATPVSATIEGSVAVNLLAFLSDPDNNLDLSTLKIIQQPASGASATIDTSHKLILDYAGKLFAGKDQLTIEVCDFDGACTQQILSITVIGDIIVYNGISPDGNKQNDTWQIQYIELLDDTKVNHVSIFNRWGDTVFEVSNYDNTNQVFTGINKNGSELPTGTYFYKIEFSSGRKTETGYLSLKR